MKSRLLGAVCACALSFSVNAAVVLFDTTEIVFSASGSANAIAGSWSANSMTIPIGSEVSFFTLEVKELSVSGGFENPRTIIITSLLIGWDLLHHMVQGHALPEITQGPVTMGWPSGGFDVSASGILSIEAYGETVVPVPPAFWLFGSGLIGLVGVAKRRVLLSCPR